MRSITTSVTIEPQVLEALAPERRENLSATVNASLRYMAALDEQRRMVDDWKAEDGAFTDQEKLAPYLEVAIRAQAQHLPQASRQA